MRDQVPVPRSAHIEGVGLHDGKQVAKAPAASGILFDPQRRAEAPELKAAIGRMVTYLLACEHDLHLRQRARRESSMAGFRLAVEAIVCNLATLLMLGIERPLAVPRKASVMRSKSRYASLVYGDHFTDVLDLMAHPSVALIEGVAKGYKFASGSSQRSTVRTLPALAARLPLAALCWASFSREEEPEVIILKAPKVRGESTAEPIQYKDTVWTRKFRKEVVKINAFLRAAPITLLSEGEPVLSDDGMPVDPNRKTVVRIFNNSRWTAGGRLWGGFWESMARADRFRLMRIGTKARPEGETIANVDYGQLFTRLAYANENLPPPDGDLYDVAGDGSSRDGYKKLLNALFFATKPMTHWPSDTVAFFPPATKLGTVLKLVNEKHAAITHLFGTGVGFQLMFQESTMLIRGLLRLHSIGIVALPLHDSVLVGVSEAETAKEIMIEAFGLLHDKSRARLKVDID